MKCKSKASVKKRNSGSLTHEFELQINIFYLACQTEDCFSVNRGTNTPIGSQQLTQRWPRSARRSLRLFWIQGIKRKLKNHITMGSSNITSQNYSGHTWCKKFRNRKFPPVHCILLAVTVIFFFFLGGGGGVNCNTFETTNALQNYLREISNFDLLTWN